MENSLYTGSIQVIVIDPVALHQLSRQLIPDDRVHCLNTFSGDSVDQDDLDDYMVTSLQSQHISGLQLYLGYCNRRSRLDRLASH